MNESDAPNSGLLTITEAEAGVKLLRFLERRLGLPRPSLFRLLRTGQVRVNKGRCKPDRVLLAGDEVRLPPQYAGLLGVTSAVVLPGSPDMAGADQARSGQKRSDRDKPAQDGPVHGGSNQARQDGLDQRKASPVRPSPAGLTPASPVANKSALTQPVSGPDAEPGSRERGSACGRQGNTENEQLSNPAAGRDFGLNILKLEKHYLVLDKPAGLPVQPGSGHSDSLSGRLKEFSAHCEASGFVIAPAHRLDMQSSGLLLAGRTYAGQRYLHGLFAAQDNHGWRDNHAGENNHGGPGKNDAGKSNVAREAARTGALPQTGKASLNRRYLAWVAGDFEFSADAASGSSVFDFPLSEDSRTSGHEYGSGYGSGADLGDGLAGDLHGWHILSDDIFPARGPDGYERMYVQGSGLPVLHDAGKCVRAASLFRVLKRLANSPIGPASLLEVQLLTGRKHQIRVQCAARGYPLIGDRRYGGPAFSGMLLHAHSITVPAGNFAGASFQAAVYSSLPAWKGCFAVTADDLPS